MRDSLYIALDFSSKDLALQFLDEHQLDRVPVKVGMQLFYREGPSLIKELKQRGHSIFLDLKLHDIPNTVYAAMKSLGKLEVDMVNVHAAGGVEMMKAACEGLRDGAEGKAPKLLAVTQLTSTDSEMLKDELLIDAPIDQVIDSYAMMSKKTGIDGVVCSVHEVKRIKERCGSDFLTLTPGIRLKGDRANDQKRVATPQLAKQQGTNYLVIGRSVTQADNPKEAYNQALKEWEDEYSQTIK
ncbi:orotidine-5'-phosphate decarboxylase [Filobacillus milosensis]|uniref:Orotidine 5'-phosphate decarboxylase n=1 Tax=Filobacillus milosensis TaxID=94137 RepID=A0A4Y8IT16_9BACI|nr:orotidine-5'-phosphate decarboxylase [Filobacillus milosensis]TFB23270.1 orotidine-5'-phosphate decarboxylase [Filobacillus milosensis]